MKSKTIGIAAIIDKAAKSPQSCFVGDIKDARPTGSVQLSLLVLNVRAKRRFKEYRSLKKGLNFKEVLKSLKKRDKSDKNRKYGPLKKTKDSILINTTNLSKRACFLKIKKIIDKRLKLNGNI